MTFRTVRRVIGWSLLGLWLIGTITNQAINDAAQYGAWAFLTVPAEICLTVCAFVIIIWLID